MDVSGTVVDVSGTVVDPSESVSGTVVDPSEAVVDVSGTVVDPSESVSGTVVDPSETVVDVSGTVVDVSGTYIGGPTIPIQEPKPDILSLDDLLSDAAVIAAKEQQDKASVEGISTMTTSALRPMLLQWASQGFPGLYEVYRLSVTPPQVCSDGTVRNLADYIEFVSGKQLHEHVEELQKKFTNITCGFVNYGSHISIVVSKA